MELLKSHPNKKTGRRIPARLDGNNIIVHPNALVEMKNPYKQGWVDDENARILALRRQYDLNLRNFIFRAEFEIMPGLESGYHRYSVYASLKEKATGMVYKITGDDLINALNIAKENDAFALTNKGFAGIWTFVFKQGNNCIVAWTDMTELEHVDLEYEKGKVGLPL